MKNKKIFFISYGVGGAEEINTIYENMKNEYSNMENITITEFATKKMNQSIYIDERWIIKYIESENPDIVINERSNGYRIQNSITDTCKKNDIFNVALLDFYGQYRERFVSVPNIIISPGMSVTEDMICDGFDKNIIITAGNPAFDRLSKYKYEKTINTKKPYIVFMSQPLKESGYNQTQFDVFKKFIKELNVIYDSYEIDIKVHPNESSANWKNFAKKFKNVNVVDCDTSDDFIKEVLKYDLVSGYNSTLMLQTNIIGIPTIYYENENTDKILSNYKNGCHNLQCVKYNDFEKNATEKVVKEIRKLI